MPRDLVKPIHTAALGLANLRFFRSPLEGPQMPWHSVEDLYRCLVMDRGLRRVFLAKLKRDWKDDIRAVATPTGPTIIAPHFMAQGLIGSMVEIGVAPASSTDAYAEAGSGAMKALTAGMDPLASMNWAIAAFRKENGEEGPHPELGEESIIRRPQR